MGSTRRKARLLVLGAAIVVSLVALLLDLRREDPALKRPVLSDELRPLVKRFGAPRYSSHDEELFVRDFFSDQRDGFFVDIGAGHYRHRSNTYFLEKELNWSGIAVDPLTHLAADYHKFRPRTHFFQMFVSNVSDQQAELYVGALNLFSSSQRSFTEEFTDVKERIEVHTVKLDDLLAAEHVGRIDFMSIDVELHEPQVLAGFDIGRFLPRLVCVEAHPSVRQQILDYFAERRYVVVGRYLRADPQNLWFMPLPEKET